MKRMVVSLILLLMVSAPGSAQPRGEEILKKVEAELAKVQDYIVTLDVAVDVDRMNVPSMHVQMYYKHPDKFHFESTSFALLPREGLAFSVARILSRFSAEEVGEGEAKKSVRISLSPKSETARVGKLVLTIDTVRWRPLAVKSFMLGGRSMTARFEHERFETYLMPSRLTVEFTSPPEDTTETPIPLPGAMVRPQMPSNGTVTIRYSDYRINTGLSDDIFTKKD